MVSSVFSTVAYARFAELTYKKKMLLLRCFSSCYVCGIWRAEFISLFLYNKIPGYFVLISNVNNDFLIMMFLIVHV